MAKEVSGELAVFFAEMDSQVQAVQAIFAKLKKKIINMRVSDSELDSTGYQLHNLYCAFVDLFLIVAKFFENSIQDSARFHMELLKRMTLQIPGVRPAYLTAENYRILNELLAFRHVFRHSYGLDLDAGKLEALLMKVLSAEQNILADNTRFRDEVAENY